MEDEIREFFRLIKKEGLDKRCEKLKAASKSFEKECLSILLEMIKLLKKLGVPKPVQWLYDQLCLAFGQGYYSDEMESAFIILRYVKETVENYNKAIKNKDMKLASKFRTELLQWKLL